MNVACLTAKNDLPFTKLEPLLLEKEGNLDRGKNIGQAYCADTSCGEFVDIHGKFLLREAPKSWNPKYFLVYLWMEQNSSKK